MKFFEGLWWVVVFWLLLTFGLWALGNLAEANDPNQKWMITINVYDEQLELKHRVIWRRGIDDNDRWICDSRARTMNDKGWPKRIIVVCEKDNGEGA